MDNKSPLSYEPTPPATKHAGSKSNSPVIVIATLLAFFAGMAGSYAIAAAGLLPNSGSQTITESRERVIAEGEVVADVANTVSPSVVSIVTSGSVESLSGRTELQGAGTGIIISKDGYILTNKHVIPEEIDQVSVVLTDGTGYENVEVVGRDPLNDIAFLHIKDVDDLIPAKLGDSGKVSVGQKVVAIGNALGQYEATVTSGIISGTGRPVVASDGTSEGIERLENLFQTDAAINPGNSGGPLVNLNGEVIGINTAIAEDAQGIGFSIPINDAKGLIKGVLANGKVTRAYLGVRYITITSEVTEEYKLSVKTGAYVGGADNPIISGGPADKAGLKNGDIITKVNDVELTEKVVLISQLSQFVPGDKVKLMVLRDGKERSIEVTLEEFRG